jgi:holo-[acyl-carrier protein] synthase
METDDGVVASALEVLEIAEVERLLGRGGEAERVFTPAERAYARSKSDPARRLAARLAAKRAACRLLGEEFVPADIEVLSGRGGPPGLRLSPRARHRLAELGAGRVLVSLTHEREHAAAAVLILRRR